MGGHVRARHFGAARFCTCRGTFGGRYGRAIAVRAVVAFVVPLHFRALFQAYALKVGLQATAAPWAARIHVQTANVPTPPCLSVARCSVTD
eukprot:2748028-Pyramimonas_sp.AAC.2